MNSIKQNPSTISTLVIQAINSNQVTISFFCQLTKDHFQRLREDLIETHDVTLPTDFPPTASTISQIEEELEGMIFDDKHIYLSSKPSVTEIAKSIIHEVCHFLNSELSDEESIKHGSKIAHYKDEIRSFIAEKNFEINNRRILRSDIKEIHNTVTDLYPEYIDSEIPISGYIYSAFELK